MSVTPLLTMPYVTNWQPKVVTPSTDPELTKIGEPHCSSHSESVLICISLIVTDVEHLFMFVPLV